jgi:outer membrane protein OmpA-like peptidoglycan-associated protein
MKSASKLLTLLAFASVFAVSLSSAHAGMCDDTGFPREKFIQTRDVCATHPVNHPGMGSTEIYTTVYFTTASTTLAPKEEAKLKEVATLLKSPAFKGKHVAVQGFTDNKGKDAANQRLSYHRAVAVMHTLIKKYGVPATMLSAQGFGKENPVADNTTAEGRAHNRRVSFAIVQ